jgi:hypothetical protein
VAYLKILLQNSVGHTVDGHKKRQDIRTGCPSNTSIIVQPGYSRRIFLKYKHYRTTRIFEPVTYQYNHYRTTRIFEPDTSQTQELQSEYSNRLLINKHCGTFELVTCEIQAMSYNLVSPHAPYDFGVKSDELLCRKIERQTLFLCVVASSMPYADNPASPTPDTPTLSQKHKREDE